MFKKTFPNMILNKNVNITSPADTLYNCIAWSIEIKLFYLWPDKDYHWPDSVPREVSIPAFSTFYKVLGYSPCSDPLEIKGFEKIALYTLDGEPTHAARHRDGEIWTSKLGDLADIDHVGLEPVSSADYGRPTHFFVRDKKIPRNPMPPLIPPLGLVSSLGNKLA